ncbi:MAG: hypothetical protein WA265_20785 [Rhodomicrobium sp.]
MHHPVFEGSIGRHFSPARIESLYMTPQKRSKLEESISIWLALIFIASNVAYFLLIQAFGLRGQPTQGWMWAIVPVLDMLYIAVQAFCLILSGARSNQFGFTDIAVSWASSVVMGVLACWALFSPTVSLSPFQTMVLVCNLVAAVAESGLTQFGRMAFSKRIIGFGG